MLGMTTQDDSPAHGRTEMDPDDVSGLMAQLPAQGGRVGVWTIDPKAGSGYVGTVEVPGGEDAEWLLEYLRTEWGPGRYQLRPKAANGRWAKGQCVVKLAQLPGEVPRVHNPGPVSAHQPFQLTPDFLRLVQQLSGRGQTPGDTNPTVLAVLVQALMNREGNESTLTRDLISAALNRSSPMGSVTEVLDLVERIRGDAPAAPAAAAPAMEGDQMLPMMMMMMMNQGQNGQPPNPMGQMLMAQAMGMPMPQMPMGQMPWGPPQQPQWGWNPWAQQQPPQQPQGAAPQQPQQPAAQPSQQPQQPQGQQPSAEEWAAFQQWRKLDPQERADFEQWRNEPLEADEVLDQPPEQPTTAPTNVASMFQNAMNGDMQGLMAVLASNPVKANNG